MDLSELHASGLREPRRHPWETARVRGLERLVREKFDRFDSLLDVGCGDGFAGLELFKRFAATRYVGCDRFLTEEQRMSWSLPQHGVRFEQELPDSSDRFDLVLLCDVIEHVKDDVALIRDAWSRVATGGLLVVTVPAFQSLFSSQDKALGHFRRYTSAGLQCTFQTAGINPMRFGYLFGTLLIPRALTTAYERMRQRASAGAAARGIGVWNGGSLMTRLVGAAFDLDNHVLLGLSKFGIRLPGLSAWAAVEKSSE